MSYESAKEKTAKDADFIFVGLRNEIKADFSRKELKVSEELLDGLMLTQMRRLIACLTSTDKETRELGKYIVRKAKKAASV